ncbi:MAG: MATE family efflux transporter [Thermoprotei archaeon]|nr:MAG: MATE family efflux transporter [Thermoprotei archaeon]
MTIIDRSVLAKAWNIAWPLMIAEAVDSLLFITDTFFVSRLGDEAVAAVGLAGYASWIFFVSTLLFYMGSMIVAAQAYGARLYDRASKALGESLTSAILLTSTTTALVILVAEDIVRLLAGGNVSPELIADATTYLQVRALGLPVLSAAMVLGAGFRATGDTKPSMIATSASAIANLILDPLLIFGLLGIPPMGVLGAAMASFIATWFSVLAYLPFIRRLPFTIKPLIPRKEAWTVFKLGLPATIERLVFALGNMAYIGAIARCGEIPLAAHTIGIRIEAFAYLPAFAIGIATTSMVGQSIGKGNLDEAKKIGWELIKVNTLFMTIMGTVLILTAPYTPTIFTNNEETRKLAMMYLILAGISEPALGAAMSASSAVRGAGNTIVPTIINATCLYTIRVALAYTLPELLPRSNRPVGAWIAMDVDLLARSIILTTVYRKKFHKLARRIVSKT